jgi:hypothetical protein
MARILATGQFQAYQRDTDVDTYKKNIKAFSEEGAIFRAEQQLIFQSDIKYLEEVDAEINQFEKEINVKSGKLNTTQVYKKRQEMERSKLNMMKARRLLLQQVSYLYAEQAATQSWIFRVISILTASPAAFLVPFDNLGQYH